MTTTTFHYQRRRDQPPPGSGFEFYARFVRAVAGICCLPFAIHAYGHWRGQRNL